MVDFNKVLDLHELHTGVLDIQADIDVKKPSDLAEAYTPGVAELSKLIQSDPEAKRKYTMSGKLVAVVTDGTAVLGLGNMGPAGGLPIVEGKALLYKELAGVDAIPIAVEQIGAEKIIETIKNISQSFAGIHLEDISAPQCFEIEERLSKNLNIPVYHDDQAGTAIVVLAGLMNAAKLVNKKLEDLKIVINGVGAAGVATGRLFAEVGIKNVTLIDIEGKVNDKVKSYNRYQLELSKRFNQVAGTTLDEVIDGQDVFIGLSDAKVLTGTQVERMAKDAIIFALANPVPEILPEEALKHGAAVVATGSNQWPNQVNNVLVFPGLFKGLLSANVQHVDYKLQANIATAIADVIKNPDRNHIVPGVFDAGVVESVTKAVKDSAK
ncbi:NADP-dependent malic enzyme [Lactococcus lactis]|uniref:NAD(P)-dependent malic enzyme n=1 Tax=Lactococcus lactis TaxID=1358 RepID=UPI0012AADCD5|nr:NADP-dependent malic enzyme [Lactococcus lactis]MCT0035018.1 NADP-dependent malic enzyme [Lactococcus lactis subsp. lactis]QPT48294.1 NADP-dependent malic enzyme [Lactococcus lactis]